MKVNRALRIVLGLILIILFGIYSFMDLSQRPTSEDFDKALNAPPPTVAPTPTEAPAESTEAPIVDAGGEESVHAFRRLVLDGCQPGIQLRQVLLNIFPDEHGLTTASAALP